MISWKRSVDVPPLPGVSLFDGYQWQDVAAQPDALKTIERSRREAPGLYNQKPSFSEGGFFVGGCASASGLTRRLAVSGWVGSLANVCAAMADPPGC